MTTKNLIDYILRFAFYLILQLVLFRYMVLFNVGFCFIYIAAILTLPKEINHVNIIILSFVLGLIVDAFYNTMGMHTAASTLIGYLRPFVAQLVIPQQAGFDEKKDFSIKSLNITTFAIYAILLIAIHHVLLFFLEMGSFSMFFTTLLKVIVSIVYTLAIIVIFQFFGKKQ
jgi:hypothetical protein